MIVICHRSQRENTLLYFIPYRKSNRSYVAIKMFEKCIRFDGNFVPAYLGLSKIKKGISSGVLLRKALQMNGESSIVRLEYADWLYAKSMNIQCGNCGAGGEIRNSLSHLLFPDLHIEALKHYTIGIQHETTLQTSFIAGALKTLRSLGQRERMYQIILR